MNTAITESNLNVNEAAETGKQYSLARILGIWVLASVPGGLLYWLGLPLLDQYTEISVRNLVLIILVLPYFWHFILTFLILKNEGNDMRWSSIKDRLWLTTTTNPRTGKKNNTLWFWLIPVVTIYALTNILPIFQSVTEWWTGILSITEPAQYSTDILFEDPQSLVGNWGFALAFLLVSILTMSEEVVLRGILLPKMNGVFGRADWVANGVLFALYHLDRPWLMLSHALYSTLTLALPARLFRSIWFSMAVHFSQAFYFLFLILGLVLGLA